MVPVYFPKYSTSNEKITWQIRLFLLIRYFDLLLEKNKEHSKTTRPDMIVAFVVSHFLAGYIRFIIEKGRKKKKQNTGKKLYLRSKNADFDKSI